MPFKSLPFLTAREHRELIESCTRTPEGCLLFLGTDPGRPNLYKVRGKWYPAARLMWAERHAHTLAAIHDLNDHEVMHLACCPHPARATGAVCIEPNHLTLAHEHGEVRRVANERKNGGVK